jgi:NDP-sugar pyrophosphorylase family protein
MKAVILAAGKGERLKELTAELPKPMIRFDGKPILQHNIELCVSHGVCDLFINTHYRADAITSYFENGAAFGAAIEYSYEPDLLGTAGALANFRQRLGSDPFYIIYGDNFSRYDLDLLRQVGEQHDAIAVIAFHYREDVSHSGVAEFGDGGRIRRFIEKPKDGETESRWVNAGIYYLSPRIFDHIPEGVSDFGRDIFPALLDKGIPIYGVCEETDVRAFDTIEMYQTSMTRAQEKESRHKT